MASTQTKEHVSLKLLVNKETNKVIYAEAGKDFVDVLCSFLTLPLGTIVRLVQKQSNIDPITVVGCLNSLYQSVANLDKECFWDETNKEMLLQPTNSSEDYCSTLKLNIDDVPTKYFTCPNLDDIFHNTWVGTSPNQNCVCGSPLTRSVFLKHSSEGFVNSGATFLFTDELILMPNSMDNLSLGLLQNFGIESTSSIKVMIENVSKEKVLDILKCALHSKSTLTDVFLEKKPFLERSRFFSCDVENKINMQFKLKLFMRNVDNKILFALGDENFADFILSFLTFPLGGVVRKFEGKCSLGSIDGLYKSIADLDEKKYFISKDAKDRLMDPRLPPQFKLTQQIVPTQEPCLSFYCHYQRKNYYESILYNEFFINHEYMSRNCRKIDRVNPQPGVHAKGPRTYVVTDDLVLAPGSPISALDIINSFGTPLKDLKEKVVTIGSKECLNILKASLTSTSALTNSLSHLFA